MIPFVLLMLAADPGPDKPVEDALPPHAVTRLGSTEFYTGICRYPCAISPDGRHFAMVGNGVVWSTVTGREEYRFQPQPGECCTYSPDGRTIAIGGYLFTNPSRAQIILIDAATGKEKAKLAGHTERIEFIAFAGEQTLVTGGADHLFRVWDLRTETEVRQFPRIGRYYPKAEGVSPDGRYFASVDHEEAHDEPLHVYEFATGRELLKVVISNNVWSLMFAPDSRSVVCFGSNIRRYELPSGRAAGTWPSKDTHGTYACSNEGLYQLKVQKNVLAAVDVATGKPADFPLRLPVTMEHRSAPTDVYIGGGPGATRLSVWDLATGRPRHPPIAGHGVYTGVVLAADGSAVTTDDWNIHRWDATGCQEQVWTLTSKHGVFSRTLAPDGRSYVIGGSGNDVVVWDTATGKQTAAFKAPFNVINVMCTFAISPDGRHLAYPSWQSLRVWDVANNRQLWDVPLTGSQHAAAVFMPSGRTIIAGDARGAIREWEVAIGKEIRQLEGHQEFMDQEPPGGFGRRTNLHPGHTGAVLNLAVSSDGRRLVPAATDRTIRIWELATGKECALLERETGSPTAEYPAPHYPLAISLDGSLLAAPGQTGDRRHLIDLWDIRAGKRFATFDGHRGAVTAIAFSPDGRRLISGGADTLGYIWEVPAVPHEPAATLDATRIANLWADLADADAAKAFRAIGVWLTAPEIVAKEFRRLKPSEMPVDAERVNRLIPDLDSDQYAARDKASKDIRALGAGARKHLRQALEKKPSPETIRRIEAILAACPDEDLRGRRAVEVLEAVGSPAARTLLEEWAKGDPTGTTGTEAATALVRLRRR